MHHHVRHPCSLQAATNVSSLATYNDLVAQYPTKGQLRELNENHQNDVGSREREKIRLSGALFHVSWYRVILDEAYYIKNHTKSSEFLLRVTKLVSADEKSGSCLLASRFQVSLSFERHTTRQLCKR